MSKMSGLALSTFRPRLLVLEIGVAQVRADVVDRVRHRAGEPARAVPPGGRELLRHGRGRVVLRALHQGVELRRAVEVGAVGDALERLLGLGRAGGGDAVRAAGVIGRAGPGASLDATAVRGLRQAQAERMWVWKAKPEMAPLTDKPPGPFLPAAVILHIRSA